MTRLFVDEAAPRDGLQMEKRFVPEVPSPAAAMRAERGR